MQEAGFISGRIQNLSCRKDYSESRTFRWNWYAVWVRTNLYLRTVVWVHNSESETWRYKYGYIIILWKIIRTFYTLLKPDILFSIFQSRLYVLRRSQYSYVFLNHIIYINLKNYARFKYIVIIFRKSYLQEHLKADVLFLTLKEIVSFRLNV